MSHQPLFASSPIFPMTSQTPTTLLEHDEHLGPYERSHCDDLRQSGGSTQTVTPTGYEPKSVETKVIDTEAIEPENLEPRRLELGRNLGTDPCQIQERFMRSSLTGDIEDFSQKLLPMCLTSSHRCIPIMIQRKALQTLTLKMEHYEKCWLHHCICKVEWTANPLECQSHRGNLLHCFRIEEQVQKVLKLISEKA